MSHAQSGKNGFNISTVGICFFGTLNLNDKVKVSVRDEGPGISKEDQIKLFGDFQRLSAQPTGGEKSTGLGLSIVKKIVESHKGTLEVESKMGSGATFSFEIPMEV